MAQPKFGCVIQQNYISLVGVLRTQQRDDDEENEKGKDTAKKKAENEQNIYFFGKAHK